METTIYLPGDEPQAPQATEAAEDLDMSTEARLARIQAVEGRLAAGELVQMDEVNPKIHCPELVARVAQVLKHGRMSAGL